jgi:hypothetical protein
MEIDEVNDDRNYFPNKCSGWLIYFHAVYVETTPPTPEIVQQLQTQSPANDDRNYFLHIH